MKLTATAWRVLWWLIGRMGEDGRVHVRNWRTEGGKALHIDRSHVYRRGAQLQTHGLIEYPPHSKDRVRVCVERLVTE